MNNQKLSDDDFPSYEELQNEIAEEVDSEEVVDEEVTVEDLEVEPTDEDFEDTEEEIEESEETVEKPPIQHHRLSQPVHEQRPVKRGGGGALGVILIGILILIIGGFSSYYYYTYRGQNSNLEKNLESIWSSTVAVTNSVADQLANVVVPDDLNKLDSALQSANAQMRDILFSLPKDSLLSQNKTDDEVSVFMNDFVDYLAVVRALATRGGAIENMDELTSLKTASEKIKDSYLKATLATDFSQKVSESLFGFAGKYETIAQKYLDEKGGQADKIKTEAGKIVTSFMQSFADKDANAMRSFMTLNARGAFQPAILENGSDIKSFKIKTSEVNSSNDQATIIGTETVSTPDGADSSHDRKFILKLVNSKWLIDSWDQV